MNGKKGSSITRREFARRAAIVSAASLVPPNALPLHSATAQPLPLHSADMSKLSPESQAEAEIRYQAILNIYGSRFSDAQKADLRRLCVLAQAPLDRLRLYPVENGDGPALYLKPLVEREKKPGAAPAPRATSPVTKKS